MEPLLSCLCLVCLKLPSSLVDPARLMLPRLPRLESLCKAVFRLSTGDLNLSQNSSVPTLVERGMSVELTASLGTELARDSGPKSGEVALGGRAGGKCPRWARAATCKILALVRFLMCALLMKATTSKAASTEGGAPASVSTYITAPRCRQRASAWRAATNGCASPNLEEQECTTPAL